MPVVTLLTDFGCSDSYVGEVKGVILSGCPAVTLVDITHAVPPGDIRAASYVLGRTWHRYPRGTVHLAVVDPGVGSSRRALVIQHDSHYFVGPDNGIFTPVLGGAVYVIQAVSDSATFHGRDLFAPVVVSLCTGAAIEDLGEPIVDPIQLDRPHLTRRDGELVGSVIHVDHFGNLITNVEGSSIHHGCRCVIGGEDVEVGSTFSDVPISDLIAYVGSGDTLVVAVRDGSAAQRLMCGVGTEVRVTL